MMNLVSICNGLDVLFIICMMQEHEQALADAIARLADISDGESGTDPL